MEAFAREIEKDLKVLIQAAHAAHDAATHSESKAEDQYDTRGLEASYLAGAQSKRAQELEELLALFRHLDVKDFTTEDKIASTALIKLTNDKKVSYFFLMPKGGGLTISHDGKTITLITPQSPMGEALLGKKVGDEIEVRIGKSVNDYEISQLW